MRKPNDENKPTKPPTTMASTASTSSTTTNSTMDGDVLVRERVQTILKWPTDTVEIDYRSQVGGNNDSNVASDNLDSPHPG